jgi:signal peptide peptidase SppA
MPAFKSHSTATSDNSWDGPANKTRVKSGENRAYYAGIYAWYDPRGDEGVKETYRFIHHEVGAGGEPGAANLTACSTGIGVLNGGRGGTTIPAADRPGVHAHLAKHLKDAGKEAPPLQQADLEENGFFQAIQDRAWALLPAKLDEISAFIERRLAGEKLEWPEAAQHKSGNRAEDPYQVINGVAVLPVYGTLDKRMNLLMKISGGTSSELLARDLKTALIDPRVDAILLDVDSPGGAVDGTKDLADLIYAARQQKPVVAYANGMMASAAYWIGSAADAVVAGETALVGSIGVAMMHYDYSGQDEKLGVKRTAIYAGKFKRIAGDEKPLSAEGRDYLQQMVDTLYEIFLNGVGRNRGLDSESVHERMGDGRLFIGKKALKAGLIDRLGNFNDALALARDKGGNMDLQTLQEKHPDLFDQVKAMGREEVTLEEMLQQHPEAAENLRAEGRTEGVGQERARVVEILEADGPADLTLAAVQEGQAPKEALKAFWASRDQLKAQALDNLKKAATAGAGQLAVETATVDPNRPIEERAQAEWDGDPKLREEFKEFAAYLAFKKAEADGRVKIKQK